MPAQKAYAAFGHVLVRNVYKDGETFDATIMPGHAFTMYWAKGAFTNWNVSTDSEWIDFPTGFVSRPGDYVPGVFRHTAVGETVVFCFDPAINRNYTPVMETWELAAGEQITMPAGTTLFLCDGSLFIDGRKFSGPMQIGIKSQDKIVVGDSKCYGLLFK
jgi:hypothetical protein